MKLFFVVIIYIFLNHCSFDDKTGIWNSNNNISKKENNLFKEFKTLSGSEEFFQKEIPIKKNFTIDLPKKKLVKIGMIFIITKQITPKILVIN